jgi:alpha-1,3-rhamnosyl/mannosyltransferase
MRVVINEMSAFGQKTGIGHYTTQLVGHLRARLGRYQVESFPHPSLHVARRAWDRLRATLEARRGGGGAPAAVRPDTLKAEALSLLRRAGRAVIAQQFRALCAQRRCQLYHEPNFIALPADVPTAATLHDLSVLLHPEWHPADRVSHFERHFERSLAQCTHFFAISEFGRQEIIRTLNVPPERVTRTYMGVRAHLRPLPPADVAVELARLHLPPRYLLYLGTLEPRKNVGTLLRAYCALPSALRAEWPLLLVGNWGWRTEAVADFYHQEARHRGVIHRAYVADQDLTAIYSGARALAFPSLYEGFGMPPLEMMACGGAVLSSEAGAMRETIGGQACLLSPLDTDGWRDALLRVVTDQEWWQSLRQGAEAVARPYTWDRCAEDTLRAYRSLCGLPADSPERAAA